ncbi:polysaccharide deacetylase [Ornithinibacillus sp. BX22]|uniref:Polysaccharide deacetylase n=2 Tax=Ornithinibacillus TaxID=484508 RepID=A0A923L2H8_9BACI|nr:MULTISPECIES: polysaccharide deacetylase family protein [Ornithinibacillus]MBC5635279.1 polysaccharide deacetylase [Ornithinibacillus hominis]MBS3678849.1 polysaccharide deacetylase [Ornithinibacillus massiliensis]
MLKSYRPLIICVVLIIVAFAIVTKFSSTAVSSENSENNSEQSLSIDSEDEKVQDKEEDTVEPSEDTVSPEVETNENEEVTEEPVKSIADETGKVVYLTFDDGPSSVSDEILDTLDQFNAKATFFMLEPAMKQYPEAVRRTVKDGHAVGLHGVTHNKDIFYKSEQSALGEMKTAQDTLESISGVHSSLIRTPYGSIPYLTDSFREVFDQNGFKLWDWNVDSSDWSLSKDEYVKNVISQVEKLENDGITPVILMHDRGETAHHLSTLLQYLQEQGFQTKVIDEHIQAYHFNCYNRCYRLP